jgi:outer membrane protein assembly factor BamB
MRLASVLMIGVAASAMAADWPQFRGPNGTGLSDEKLPAEWGTGKNVAWKAAVPGVAWSCPIIVGDKVIVTTAFSENQPKPRSGFGGGGGGRPGGGGGPPGGGGGGGGRPGGRGAPDAVYQYKVVCLDRSTGKVVWEATAQESKPRMPTHGSNTFASETPASDGERVFAFFGNTGLYAFDLAGKPLWKKDTGAYPMMGGWGTSSSPVVHDGKVFVQCDNEQKSFLAAFDAKTGDEVWRKDRQEKSGWSTPYLWKQKGRTDLVVLGGQKLRGYNPADGSVVWELTVGGGQCSASPTSDDDHLYVGAAAAPGGGRPGGGPPGGGGRPGGGSGGTMFAVKTGATGDITPKAGEATSTGVTWSVPRVWPAAASPLAYRGKVYLLDRQGGMVSCYDAKTGKADYAKERIPLAKAFWASPWADDGKVFCLDEDGQTHVLKAGPAFEVLTVNKLDKELFWATPAAAGGALFVRGIDSLYCVK